MFGHFFVSPFLPFIGTEEVWADKRWSQLCSYMVTVISLPRQAPSRLAIWSVRVSLLLLWPLQGSMWFWSGQPLHSHSGKGNHSWDISLEQVRMVDRWMPLAAKKS